jgi:hypothetical protein
MMKKQNFKTGLNLKKNLVSNLTTDEVLGGVVGSTIGGPTCRESRNSVCPTYKTQTYCVGCNSWYC